VTIARGRFSAMGGDVAVTAVGAADGALDAVEALVRELEARWTRFDANSDVARLNAAGGAEIDVHPETAALLSRLAALADETLGAFDPTVLPDLVAAGYDRSRSSGREAPALPVGVRRGGDLSGIRIDGARVALPADMTLDLGGVAKGHTADLAVALLRTAGARGAFVGVAGDVAVWGERPGAGPWRIGVEDPRDHQRWVAIAEVAHGAIATSSRWKRRWSVDGEDRNHLIDPATGRSVQSPVLSMTVVAETGARAEAWAKTGFVRPAERALADAEQAGLRALVVDENGATFTTENWNIPC
jgi:thiamine biosynthesis lipoprotein